jgi:hypothetical protein
MALVDLLLKGGTDPSSAAFSPYLNHMLNTRRIIVLPVSNPWGYDRRRMDDPMTLDPERYEVAEQFDPNRDFPYNQAAGKCMQTTVARAVNEIFRSNLIQNAVTFHGGEHSISYEWGASNHLGSKRTSESPDDVAQAAIASVMRDFAGNFEGDLYPVGRINNVVYFVAGGMEYWSYAGSWDSGAVPHCNPTTFGGYPAEKTTYNDAQLRAFNILVEADDFKIPPEERLGLMDPASLLRVEVGKTDAPGDGHVPKNLRLCLVALDMVAPYVVVTAPMHRMAKAVMVPLPRVSSSDGEDEGGAPAAYDGPKACTNDASSVSTFS